MQARQSAPGQPSPGVLHRYDWRRCTELPSQCGGHTNPCDPGMFTIPGTDVVVDGASENSPFEVGRNCAIYANHSRRPNARLELWPVLRPAACELRQHMVLVASEKIEAGAEIRIDYESGGVPYWGCAGESSEPRESEGWRAARRHPPPAIAVAADLERLVDGLSRLQRAASGGSGNGSADLEASSGGLIRLLPGHGGAPLAWVGAAGGDARLRVLVPQLARKLAGLKEQRTQSSHWGLVATHLPGRTGRECRDRWWELIQAEGLSLK